MSKRDEIRNAVDKAKAAVERQKAALKRQQDKRRSDVGSYISSDDSLDDAVADPKDKPGSR